MLVIKPIFPFRKVWVLFLVVLVHSQSFAVGESAIIALVQPVGAENLGMGECGVSLDNTGYCAFFNPASVASFGKKQELQFFYSTFDDFSWAGMTPSDIYHADTSFGVFLGSFLPYVDFGYVHYANFFNMGINSWTDSLGADIGQLHSYEVVNANVFGLTLFDAVSIGGTIKNFDSQLEPLAGPKGPGTAQGTNYDLGVRLHKEFNFKDLLVVEPAIGMSWLTLGKDKVSYGDPTHYDALPRQFLYGLSTTLDLLGLLSYTGALEMHRDDYHVTRSWVDSNNVAHDTAYDVNDRRYHEGHRFGITPFHSRYFGYYYDLAGERVGKSNGWTTTVNLRVLLNTFVRIADLFDKNIGIQMKAFENRLFPLSIRPNLYVSKSESTTTLTVSGYPFRLTHTDLSIGVCVSGSLESIRAGIAQRKAQSSADRILQDSTSGQEPNRHQVHL
jgi:hypothetical protein